MNMLKKPRVFISGISGFVGSSLHNNLKTKEFDIYGISRSIQGKNILTADITDFQMLNDFILKNKIDCIIHLAGESLVESGQKDPFTTFRMNIQGTLNVLEAARQNKLERVIIASTSHVYGKNKVPYYEGYMPRPSRPYETSKACTDLIAQSYAETYNLPVLIPRFVNIYGPGDLNFSRLIPKTIKAIIEGKNPEMWGGQAMREYLFIDDAVRAYQKLLSLDLSKVGKNRIFNIGSGEIISVKDLVEKIIKISGSNKSISRIDDKREMEINNQFVAIKKAKKILGWDAKVDLDRGITKTIAWYRKLHYNIG